MLRFDANVLQQPVGTQLHGYLQSWRYFHPHASDIVQKTLKVPLAKAEEAAAFVSNIRTTLSAQASSHGGRPIKLVAVHVRRGDKLNHPHYDQWSINEPYYKKAFSLLAARHSWQHLAFLFFTGGELDEAGLIADSEWTKTTLTSFLPLSDRAFFSEGTDYLKDLHAFGLCDIFITGPSSFSWWAAYLAASKGKMQKKDRKKKKKKKKEPFPFLLISQGTHVS